MVDLVKIRRKAKEKKEAAERAAEEMAMLRRPEPERVNTPSAKSESPAFAEDDARKTQTGNYGQKAAVPSSPPVAPEKKEQQPAKVGATGTGKPTTRPGAGTGQPAPEPETGSPSSSRIARFLETAGQRRTQQKRGDAEADAIRVELLTFTIAGETYAVPIDNIFEIVTPRAMTPVPNSDPSIVGIMSLRGVIVTLIDVRRRLHHPQPEAAGPDARIIVVQQSDETLGFSVDRVLRVVKIDADAVDPHPVAHNSEQSESVRGVFQQADALTILLDLDKLLATTSDSLVPAS